MRAGSEQKVAADLVSPPIDVDWCVAHSLGAHHLLIVSILHNSPGSSSLLLSTYLEDLPLNLCQTTHDD